MTCIYSYSWGKPTLCTRMLRIPQLSVFLYLISSHTDSCTRIVWVVYFDWIHHADSWSLAMRDELNPLNLSWRFDLPPRLFTSAFYPSCIKKFVDGLDGCDLLACISTRVVCVRISCSFLQKKDMSVRNWGWGFLWNNCTISMQSPYVH